MPEDKIIIECNKCHKKYKVPREYINKKLKCKKCANIIIVKDIKEKDKIIERIEKIEKNIENINLNIEELKTKIEKYQKENKEQDIIKIDTPPILLQDNNIKTILNTDNTENNKETSVGDVKEEVKKIKDQYSGKRTSELGKMKNKVISESKKRSMISKYFQQIPGCAFFLMFIGFAITFFNEWGYIPIFFGFIGILPYFIGRPTEKQIDEWLDEDINNLKERGIVKLGINKSELVGEPVTVSGPHLWDIGNAKVLSKKGTDNILRFTPINVSIIYFSSNQIMRYSCILDFTRGTTINETTDEYFYKDVVSVSTKTESRTVNIKKIGTLQLNEAETFTLTTSGGTSLSVLLRDATLIKKLGGGKIPILRAENAIQTIRNMLREKKV